MRTYRRWTAALLAVFMLVGNPAAFRAGVAEPQSETKTIIETETQAEAQTEAQTEMQSETAEVQTVPADFVQGTVTDETAEVQTEMGVPAQAETQMQEEASGFQADISVSAAANGDAKAQEEQEEPVLAKEDVTAQSGASETAKVKALIEGLPELHAVTKADANKIMAAMDAYQKLSVSEQKELDEQPMGGGQPYGRVLETAVWGLALLDGVNASTTLVPGTYDETTTPALASSYSKGKSTSSRDKRWSVKSVTVSADGKATAVITVESDSYTQIRTNGQSYQKTNASGNSEFANVPIDLNSTFYIAAYSTLMKSEIAFSITTSIDEGEAKPEPGESEVPEESEEQVPLTGIVLSETKLVMEEKQIQDGLQVTFQPENTTFKGNVSWSSDHPQIVEVNAQTGELTAVSAGSAKITASAEDVSAVCEVEVTARAAQEGMVNLTVSNQTAMFKGVDAYLETKDGHTVLYITLNGNGYRELYIGSYEDAVATGSDSSQWIRGRKRTDKTVLSYVDTDGKTKTANAAGKWQFAIPVAADVTYLQVQALSDAHKKDGNWWYPRQFVIDQKKQTLAVDDYHGNDALQVKCDGKVPQVEQAALLTEGGPHSNSYAVMLELLLQSSNYTKAFLGTADAAEKNKADVLEIRKQKTAFVVEQIVGTGSEAKIASRIDTPFALSLYDASAKKWVTVELTIHRRKGTLQVSTFDESGKDTGNDQFSQDKEDQRTQSNSDTMPGTVDSSTRLADGVYTPGQFKFTYSGGSGRVVIRCSQVEVKGGRAYATITFSRSAKQGGSSNYDMLRANGTVYNGKNTFTFPVQLNKNNTIVGRTVAMSAPHWVEYTIFISISEPGKETGTDVAENKKMLDLQIPAIMGLEGEKEIEVVYSDKLKIFSYKEGYYLIEINLVKGSDREEAAFLAYLEQLTEENDQAQPERAEAELAVSDAYEEEMDAGEGAGNTNMAAESSSGQAAFLYAHPVIKYLVVPEGKEVPAGLEKELVIIRQPCDWAYVSSLAAVAMLEQLSLTDAIHTIGIAKEGLLEAGFEALAARMELPEEDEQFLAWGGNYDDPELRTLLRRKTDLLLQDVQILAQDIENPEQEMEQLLKLADRTAQMNAAMWIDRSAEETNPLAAAEWYKAYGIIFGCGEQGETAYREVVQAASEQDKQDALAELDGTVWGE